MPLTLTRILISLLIALLPLGAAPPPLKVVSLHPLLTDACRRVGGDAVETIDLVGPKNDPHSFQPQPQDLEKTKGAALYLASGMGLESWLPAIKSIIPDSTTICQVGDQLPALTGGCDHPGHHHHIDPHWWHSIPLYIRAVGIIEKQLTTLDPAHATTYAANAKTYRTELEKLAAWSRKEIARIPRDQRKLATAHAAFNYFCKDYGFTPLSVQGINREQTPTPAELAKLIATLRKNHITAVFPEKNSNPKTLTTITKDTGIRLATPLIADGTGTDSYEAMVRHNVSSIVKALAPSPQSR